MIAGLAPFTCNTGGVAEESVEDDAAAPWRANGGKQTRKVKKSAKK
jgi:hypothetical protein